MIRPLLTDESELHSHFVNRITDIESPEDKRERWDKILVSFKQFISES